MSNNSPKMTGLTIEKLSLSWWQILVGTFMLGTFAYTTTQQHVTLTKVEETQKRALTTYVPIIERLNNQSSSTSSAIQSLEDTIKTFNNNIVTILALRDKEEKDRSELVKKVDQLTVEVTDLKVKIANLSYRKEF